MMTNKDQKLCDWLAVHMMGYRLVKVNGATWYESFEDGTDHRSSKPSWNPVEDARDTQRVKDKMRALHWFYKIEVVGLGANILVTFYTVTGSIKTDESYDANDHNELRAVCLAAKAAAKDSE